MLMKNSLMENMSADYVRTALAKDPEKRPANAMAFAQMLQEAAGPS